MNSVASDDVGEGMTRDAYTGEVVFDALTDAQAYVVCVYLFSVGLAAGLLNVWGLVLHFLYRRKLVTVEGTPRLGLVLNNFFMSMCHPFSVATLIHGHWIYGSVGCRVLAAVWYFFGMNQLVGLAFMALSRYLVVTRKERTSTSHWVGRFPTMLGIMVLSNALWVSFPLMGWAQYSETPYEVECTLDWYHPTPEFGSYVTALSLFNWLLPFLLTVWSYSKVAAYMRRHPDVTVDWAPRGHAGKLMVASTLLTFGTYSLYGMLCFVSVFLGPNSVSPKVALVPSLMAKSLAAFQPILYLLLNPRLMGYTRQLLCGGARRLEVGPDTSFADAAHAETKFTNGNDAGPNKAL